MSDFRPIQIRYKLKKQKKSYRIVFVEELGERNAERIVRADQNTVREHDPNKVCIFEHF